MGTFTTYLSTVTQEQKYEYKKLNLQDVFLRGEDSMHLETVPSHIVEPESQKWFH